MTTDLSVRGIDMGIPHLPCLIFSADHIICDEHGVLSSVMTVFTLDDLGKRFLRSLYGDIDDFCEYCSSDNMDDYRVYRLRCFSPGDRFKYAFCEKNEILGEILTVVYLSGNTAKFYPLMSPGASVVRTFSEKMCNDLYKIKSSAGQSGTSLSAEAFSVVERIPRLAEAIFDKTSSSRYCDLVELTDHAAGIISSSPVFGAEIVTAVKRGEGFVFRKDDVTPNILELPVEAYTAVLSLICRMMSSLSASHSIKVCVAFYSYAADVEIVTETNKISKDIDLSGLGILRSVGVREGLIRAAETIAYISGIDVSVSYEQKTGKLSIVIGLGYEMQSMPDFKYSDPLENVSAVIDEIADIYDNL